MGKMSESWGGTGGGWGNPVVGGTALRIPAINSPNFNLANPTASPSPSWAILQNGLAYFFGLILSGGTITGPDYIINTSGAFFYSGTPALGNLLLSIAATGGTDVYGNVYKSGFVVYGSSGSNIEITVSGGLPVVGMPPGGVTHMANPPQLYTGAENPGAANEFMVTNLYSGDETGSTGSSAVQLFTDANNSATAHGILSINGTALLTWQTGAVIVDGELEVTGVTDTGTLAVNGTEWSQAAVPAAYPAVGSPSNAGLATYCNQICQALMAAGLMAP
jgi:hypothetical protein